MSTSLNRPPVLREGDQVALITPASPVRDEDELGGCIVALEELGLRPRVGWNVKPSSYYKAGPDELRTRDLNWAIEDPAIRAIFCVRGGFGSARLRHLAFFQHLRRDPKLFVGFSDLTALHAAIHHHAGLATLHAPTVAMSYIDERLTDESLALVHRALFDPSPLGSVSALLGRPAGKRVCGGKARGVLMGGNLTVLASLMGSSHLPSPEGAILFLEDVNEEPYRLERCLTQLEYAGWIHSLAGVILGQFTRCDSSNPARPDARHTLMDFFEDMPFPVLEDFPAGHDEENVPLPMGMMATLDANKEDLVLEEGFSPVR